jgi:hypothetical protein
VWIVRRPSQKSPIYERQENPGATRVANVIPARGKKRR